MKIILSLLCFLSFIQPAYSNELEARLEKLEAKITQLEDQQSKKLEWCESKYKYYTTRTNRCPKNTFINSVFLLQGSGVIQVECGYYQLQCFKTMPNGAVESYDVPMLTR